MSPPPTNGGRILALQGLLLLLAFVRTFPCLSNVLPQLTFVNECSPIANTRRPDVLLRQEGGMDGCVANQRGGGEAAILKYQPP